MLVNVFLISFAFYSFASYVFSLVSSTTTDFVGGVTYEENFEGEMSMNDIQPPFYPHINMADQALYPFVQS